MCELWEKEKKRGAKPSSLVTKVVCKIGFYGDDSETPREKTARFTSLMSYKWGNRAGGRLPAITTKPMNFPAGRRRPLKSWPGMSRTRGGGKKKKRGGWRFKVCHEHERMGDLERQFSFKR